MTKHFSLAFTKIAELCESLGVSSLKDHDGAWLHKVDEHWSIAINGHTQEVEANPEGSMGATIPPFHAAVWFNGFLAGFLNPYEGSFAAGSGANEDTFIAALDSAIGERV